MAKFQIFSKKKKKLNYAMPIPVAKKPQTEATEAVIRLKASHGNAKPHSATVMRIKSLY